MTVFLPLSLPQQHKRRVLSSAAAAAGKALVGGKEVTGRGLFVALLEEIAADLNLDFRALSHNWIIQMQERAPPRNTITIFGYTFDLNGAASKEICVEKSATALLLSTAKPPIPCVPHQMFLNPAFPPAADFVPDDAHTFELIMKEAQKYDYQVVLKPLKGTGGGGVQRCRCAREVEAAAMRLFQTEQGLAVSPYQKIADEYRVVVLQGSVEMVYRKVRGSVVGDGVRSVRECLVESFMAAKNPASFSMSMSELGNEVLRSIPAEGEEIYVQWKHNLGLGATADFDVCSHTRSKLADLALATCRAVGGLGFCSVDIVCLEEGEAGGDSVKVLEVNSGVMMDNLLLACEKGRLSPEIRPRIKAIYSNAVKACFARNSLLLGAHE